MSNCSFKVASPKLNSPKYAKMTPAQYMIIDDTDSLEQDVYYLRILKKKFWRRNKKDVREGCCVLCERNLTECVHPVGYTNFCAVTRLRRAGLPTAV